MPKFVKGQSGNPGGRPKTVAFLRELAQQEVDANIRTLKSIRDNSRAPATARIAAVRELFDRGFGKSIQATDGDSEKQIVNFNMINRLPKTAKVAAD